MEVIQGKIISYDSHTLIFKVPLTLQQKDILHGFYKDETNLDIKIDKHREARSNDANSYCWKMCQTIADNLKEAHTKEYVYRRAIREVGQFDIVPIKTNEVEKFLKRWEELGYGFFAEVIGASKLDGYTNVIQYYGSHVYDTREMSVLIDWIVHEATQMGLETKRPEEIKSMMEAWK